MIEHPALLRASCRLIAQRRLELRVARIGPVLNPDAWLEKVAEVLVTEHATRYNALFPRDVSQCNPDSIARLLDPMLFWEHIDPQEEILRAQLAIALHNERRRLNACPSCGGSGWEEVEDGDVVRCHNRLFHTPTIADTAISNSRMEPEEALT